VAGSPGNTNGATHGVTSERHVTAVAARHRRRLLRRLALSPRQLGPIGRGYLDSYVRLTAKIELADAYIEEHGLIRADGEPQPVLRLYVSLQNAARLALARLEHHLRVSAPDDPRAALDAYLKNSRDDEPDAA
jgi:hypothetical protein